MNNRAKRKLRYNSSWETYSSISLWISRSKKGDKFAFCKFCQTDFLCTDGILQLRKHEKSVKHIRHSGLKEVESQKRSEYTPEGDNESPEDASPTPVKNLSYIHNYNPEWEVAPSLQDWISPSILGEQHAFCLACEKNVKIGHNGKHSLFIHERGLKHKRNLDEMKNRCDALILPPQTYEESYKVIKVDLHDSDDSFENDFEMNNKNPKKKKQKLVGGRHYYLHKYNPRWELLDQFAGWLMPSNKSQYSAFCQLCDIDLETGTSGKSALERHAKGKRHKKLLSLEISHTESDIVDSNSIDPQGELSPQRTVTKSGKKIYTKCYQRSWENDGRFYDWLTNSLKGPSFAYCKVCRKDFSIFLRGSSDAITHSKSKKHQKNLQESLSPDYAMDSLNCHLVDYIKLQLPRLPDEEIQKLVTFLRDNLGIEQIDDLIHLQPSDFADFLKPIQARKLVDSLKTGVGEFRLYMQLRQAESSVYQADEPLEMSRCIPEVVTHTIEENSIDETVVLDSIEPDKPPVKVEITMEDLPPNEDDILMEYQERENLSEDLFSLKNEDEGQIFIDSSEILSFTKSCNNPSALREASVEEDLPETLHEMEKEMRKGLWLKEFCIASGSVPPQIISSLRNDIRPSEANYTFLIKIIALKVFDLCQKPHIDDLRLLSSYFVHKFPCLQNPENESIASYELFFQRLRRRIYSLREQLPLRKQKNKNGLKSQSVLSNLSQWL